MTPQKHVADPQALSVLRRHLWTKRATIAFALILAAVFFISREEALNESHLIAAAAFFAIFLGGGRRAIASKIEDVEVFELWVDDEKLRWRLGSEDRGELARNDIAEVIDKKSHGLEVRQKSGPRVLRIPRQLTHYEELRRVLLSK